MGTTAIVVEPATPAEPIAETPATAEVIQLAAAAGAATEAARNAQSDAGAASSEISQLRTEVSDLRVTVTAYQGQVASLEARMLALETEPESSVSTESVVQVEPVAAPPASTEPPREKRGTVARMFLGK